MKFVGPLIWLPTYTVAKIFTVFLSFCRKSSLGTLKTRELVYVGQPSLIGPIRPPMQPKSFAAHVQGYFPTKAEAKGNGSKILKSEPVNLDTYR